MIRERVRNKKDLGGLIHVPLRPGAFYRSSSIGGFTDSLTDLHIAGPSAICDPVSRAILDLVLKPPTQIFSHKIIRDPKARDEFIETEFTAADEYGGFHDGLSLANDTGTIVEVSDAEMQKLWPEEWANRKERFVFNAFASVTETVTQPLADLVLAAEAKMLKARQDAGARDAASAKAASER